MEDEMLDQMVMDNTLYLSAKDVMRLIARYDPVDVYDTLKCRVSEETEEFEEEIK